MKYLAVLPLLATAALAAPACRWNSTSHNGTHAHAHNGTHHRINGTKFHSHNGTHGHGGNNTVPIGNGTHIPIPVENGTISIPTGETPEPTIVEPTESTTSPITSETASATTSLTDLGNNNADIPTTTITTESSVASPTPTPTPTPTGNSESGTSTGNADADKFVSLHNDFRAKYGAGPLAWNSTLATFAQGVADKCKMQHSGGPYGENLAAGAGGGYDITSGFNSWADEASSYDWNNPGVGAGHFTQAVWKATTQLGCATQTCPDGSIFTGYGTSLLVVCNYYVPGNMQGDNMRYYRENVGTLQA